MSFIDDEVKWVFKRTITTFLSWTFAGICMAGGILLLIQGGTLRSIVGTLLILVGLFFIAFAKALSRWFQLKGMK
jgi:hypothetical protein